MTDALFMLEPVTACRPPVRAARPEAQEAPVGTLNCFSVDVEEYFHAEAFARTVCRADWPRFECRAQRGLERLAALLAATGNRATFFVLGWTLPKLAPLLRALAAAGHEIACHGDQHAHLGRLTPTAFRDDVRTARARLADTLGVLPRGYRAPTFSITRATAWAIDVLAAEGFDYDASIFPIHHDRYGVPAAPTAPFRVRGPGGAELLEFPPLTLCCGPLRIPVGGGGYLRLLPGAVLRNRLRNCERRGRPAMVYVHPWELDPDQPRLPAGRLTAWRHRLNLAGTEAKLAALLRASRFDTAARVLAEVLRGPALPRFALSAAPPATSQA